MTSGRFGALWLVAAGLVTGVAVIGLGHVRYGGLVVAATLVGAAVLRLLLPRAPAGGLVVRSRLADVVFLFAMGLGLFVIVIAVDLHPRS